MQNNKRVNASARERELLRQFGVEKDLQIKICKLKVYTFKGVRVEREKVWNKRERSTQKLKELSNSQINPANCLKETKLIKYSQSSYVRKHSSSFKNHSTKHLVVKPKPFKCKLCEYSTRVKTVLVAHTRTHTGEKPFKCVLCTRRFVTKGNLNQHIRTHTWEKFYQCQFCRKRFSISGHKNRHEKICKFNPKQADDKWVENQKKFKCTICRYSVISMHGLKAHLNTHTGEKEFHCKLCSSKFKTNSSLRRHIFTHTGEKPFPCQFCKRAFAQKSTMNYHEQTCKLNPKLSDKKYVELLKKFKCDKCTYSDRTKKSLKVHLKIHTGEKQFSCPLCTYKCRTKANMDVHIRTHTKEKPFKCPHCEYDFGHKGHLRTHVNARHCEGVRQK